MNNIKMSNMIDDSLTLPLYLEAVVSFFQTPVGICVLIFLIIMVLIMCYQQFKVYKSMTEIVHSLKDWSVGQKEITSGMREITEINRESNRHNQDLLRYIIDLDKLNRQLLEHNKILCSKIDQLVNGLKK